MQASQASVDVVARNGRSNSLKPTRAVSVNPTIPIVLPATDTITTGIYQQIILPFNAHIAWVIELAEILFGCMMKTSERFGIIYFAIASAMIATAITIATGGAVATTIRTIIARAAIITMIAIVAPMVTPMASIHMRVAAFADMTCATTRTTTTTIDFILALIKGSATGIAMNVINRVGDHMATARTPFVGFRTLIRIRIEIFFCTNSFNIRHKRISLLVGANRIIRPECGNAVVVTLKNRKIMITKLLNRSKIHWNHSCRSPHNVMSWCQQHSFPLRK
jgi:hypothetical protein